jgi:molybdopterin/thiamine biosynthesis adenylyltransferase
MLPWFLRDPERFKREREGIENLSRSADWLVGCDWSISDGLCLDAIIRAHGHDYEVRISFPALFPEVPLVIRPRNVESRISGHQYGGADGPLCLERGPDNWHRDVTVVEMLESAHKLFEIENPLGQNRPEKPVIAPSRHQLTIGQELRGEWARWYKSAAFQQFLASRPKVSVGGFQFSFRKLGENWVTLLHEAMSIGGETWKDTTIPVTLPAAEVSDLYSGIWFKTDLDASAIGKPEKLADLRQLLGGQDGAKFLAIDGTSPISGFQRSIAGVLISDRDGNLHLFVILSGDKAVACSEVRSEKTVTHVRSPDSVDLTGKSVGIVGLGSAGSKIATSLARMGVHKFYLVDHDVLLPENLQRHALDWQGVAQHKVDATATTLRHIAPDVIVEVSRLHLTGQESNASVSGAMDRLRGCDLLVDATADSRVFNLLAALAQIASKPLVWVEVFGGGIGGLVARSRPGQDPCPQDMRMAYLQYCNEHPSSHLRDASEKYTVESSDGDVLTASDAEVALIAHHAARFVPDCFVSPDRSKFPYSMYLIGFQNAWVFEAPFATIPISMASLPATQPPAVNDEIGAENTAFLVELLKKQSE